MQCKVSINVCPLLTGLSAKVSGQTEQLSKVSKYPCLSGKVIFGQTLTIWRGGWSPGGHTVPVKGAVEQFVWVSSASFRLQTDIYLHCGGDTGHCKPGFCSDWSPSDLDSSFIPSQLRSWGGRSKLQHGQLSCGILNPSLIFIFLLFCSSLSVLQLHNHVCFSTE